jgi:predicted PurR-regulated permease PerM
MKAQKKEKEDQVAVQLRDGDAEPAPVGIRMPVDIRNAALTVIAGIACVLFLQYAQDVVIPVILSALTFYALDPLVDRLERWRIHRAIGAALVLLTLVGSAGYGAYTLRDDAMAIIEGLPRAAKQLRASLQSSQQEPGAIDKLQEAAKEIDRTAAEAAGPEATTRGVTPVQVVQPFRASDYLVWGSMGAVTLIGQGVMILFLAYFLLVADDLYRKKLVKITPTLSKKKITLQIVEEIGNQIERFMLVQIFTSALVAVVTALALWWLGLKQPVVWGIAAGVLNSIPYFGPIIVTAGLSLVSYIQFGTIQMMLSVAGIALLITTLEGWGLTPMLMGKAASINPAAIFVAILFWSWIWGAWGLILAVPMVMMVKAVCDRIEELQPIGELLGE